MTTTQKAMQLALDDLLKYVPYHDLHKCKSIAALKAAQEQPKTNQCGEVCERAKLCPACSAALAQEPVTERIRLTDGDWPIIELGYGKVEVAEGWQGETPALIFGHNGSGKIGEPTQPDRVHEAGETIAVVTFANVESLDVVAAKIAKIRAERFAAPQPAVQEITNAQIHEIYCKDKGAGEWRRHAENYYAGFRMGRRYAAPQPAEDIRPLPDNNEIPISEVEFTTFKVAQEEPALARLLRQVIYGDFTGDNPRDMNLALAARSEYLAMTAPQPAAPKG